MKTYVLMVSRTFMKSHPRAGQLTYFKEQILHKIDPNYGKLFITSRRRVGLTECEGKITTIRGNYAHWVHVAEEVNAGRGVLSLRQWTGSPYNYARDGSKQQEFLRLEKMGVQRIRIEDHRLNADLGKGKNIFASVDDKEVSFITIAKNDGLSWDDAFYWFGGKPGKRLPMFDGALIQFTEFNY